MDLNNLIRDFIISKQNEVLEADAKALVFQTKYINILERIAEVSDYDTEMVNEYLDESLLFWMDTNEYIKKSGLILKG